MLRHFSFLVVACSFLFPTTSPLPNDVTAAGSDCLKWSSVTVRKDADVDYLFNKPAYSAPAPAPGSAPAANAPAASNGDLFMTSFDATAPAELNAKIRAIHDEFLAGDGKPLESAQMRPVYAPTEVVNTAFREWIGEKPDFMVCKGQMHDAIFATPPKCMRATLVPGHLPKVINERRLKLNKRSTPDCIYTSVRCVSENFFKKTGDDLVRELQNQKWDQPFFAPEKLFAPKTVVEQAWKQWNQVRLGGVEGVKTDGCICGKPKNDLAINDGSYLAVFANNATCAKNPVPPCRLINVECV